MKRKELTATVITKTQPADESKDMKNQTTMSSPGKSPGKGKRDRNFYLPHEIPKQHKKNSLQKQQEEKNKGRDALSTPTTENLRNTFVIKNSSASFDVYYK